MIELVLLSSHSRYAVRQRLHMRLNDVAIASIQVHPDMLTEELVYLSQAFGVRHGFTGLGKAIAQELKAYFVGKQRTQMIYSQYQEKL